MLNVNLLPLSLLPPLLYPSHSQPHILYLHDWDHPEKLIVGKELDLSRSHPKDSPFIRHLAEQLTLMEFAVYAAVQRR